MAKRYDPIMCMLVDEPTKAQDAEKLHYYQHSYTKKWYVVSPDGKVFKEFNTEAEAKNYVNGKAQDSAFALDKAIKAADGMFASAFGEYSKGAKFKKDKFLKELAGISDAKEFAQRMQTLDNELRKNLERLDEAYNVAAKDYYAARNEIRSIMDAFSSEAFNLYKKLGTK